MPSRADDRFFGAKKGSAHRAWMELVKQYGLKEGDRIWHALRAERKAKDKTYGSGHSRRRV